MWHKGTDAICSIGRVAWSMPHGICRTGYAAWSVCIVEAGLKLSEGIVDGEESAKRRQAEAEKSRNTVLGITETA